MLTTVCNVMLVSRGLQFPRIPIFSTQLFQAALRESWQAETDHRVGDIAETGSCERVCQSA